MGVIFMAPSVLACSQFDWIELHPCWPSTSPSFSWWSPWCFLSGRSGDDELTGWFEKMLPVHLEDSWAGFTILGRFCSFVIQSFITLSSYCLLGFWETWSAWCPTPLNGILLGCVVCLWILCHGLVLLGLNHLRPLIFLSWTFYVRIEKVLFLSSLTLFLPPLYEPASPVFTCELDSFPLLTVLPISRVTDPSANTCSTAFSFCSLNFHF